MPNVKVSMPGGGDEFINPGAVLTIREALPHEKNDSPEVKATIRTGSGPLFAAESVSALRQKFAESKLAEVTAPDGSRILVAMPRVTDCDKPTAQDHENARAVLRFGPGADAPRQGVRETPDQLRPIWDAAGEPTAIFD